VSAAWARFVVFFGNLAKRRGNVEDHHSDLQLEFLTAQTAATQQGLMSIFWTGNADAMRELVQRSDSLLGSLASSLLEIKRGVKAQNEQVLET
jgi:hypothetical protein